MKPSVLILALATRLEQWRDADATRPRLAIEIARDVQHALGKLVDATRKPIVVIAWGGEDGQGEDMEDANLARQTVDVFIGWNPGISSKRDAESIAMADVVRDVKNVCLGLDTVEGEDHECLTCGGASPVALPDGFPLAAFRLRINLDDNGGEIITEVEPEE